MDEFKSVDEVTMRLKQIDRDISNAQDKIEQIQEWLKPWEDVVIQGRYEKNGYFR